MAGAEQIIASIEAVIGGIAAILHNNVASVSPVGRSLSYTAAADISQSPAQEPTATVGDQSSSNSALPPVVEAANQPVVETVPSANGTVTAGELSNLLTEFARLLTLLPSVASSAGTTPSNDQANADFTTTQQEIADLQREVAQTNRIDTLSNVTLISPTVVNGSLGGGSQSGGAGSFDSLSVSGASSLSSATAASLAVTGTSTLAGLNLVSTNCSTYGNAGKLTTDAFGNVICAADQGGSGSTVGGADTQVQFNSGGSFAGSAGFTFASSTGKLTVSNASTTNLSVSGNSTLGSATSTSLFSTLANFTTAIANTFNASVANIVGFTATNATTTNLVATNATTTNFAALGTSYFAGNIGIGTTTPGSIFSVQGVGNWTSATTTYYSTGGINLKGGCFSINGSCIGGGGGGTWGGITGTLSNQTDLQNALNAKLSLASWYATTTDGLAQGTSNKYFSNALAQGAISVSGIPLTYAGGVIGINQASGSQPGFLASADWTNFNGKLASSSLSAGAGISYNFSTGVIANTGVTSVAASGGSTGLTFSGSPITTTGTFSLGGMLGIGFGGTGTSTAPSYGQLLVGNAGGGYTLTSTSSLGILSGGTWGGITGTLSNQTDLQNALNLKLASSSLATSALLAGLVSDHTGSGSLAFATSPTFSGTPVFGGGTINYSVASTSTIPNNTPGAWALSTSTTGAPLLSVDTTSGSISLGAQGSSILIGGASSSPNLVFENNATIEGLTGQTLTFGAGSDIIDFGVNTGFGTTTPGSILSVQGVGNFVSGATSTLYNGLNVAALNVTGNSTSTHADGINILTGCFSINGACIGAGGGTSYTFSYPLLNTANTISLAFGTTTTNVWSNLQTFSNINLTSSIQFNGQSTITATTSAHDLAIGYQSLLGNLGADSTSTSNTSGQYNIAIGEGTLQLATSTADNIAIGFQALYNAVNDNVSGGSPAATGGYNAGSLNTAIGVGALFANTNGSQNDAVGYNALNGNTIGVGNSAFGNNAMQNNTSGNANVGIGNYALQNSTTGSLNVAIGANAFIRNTTGSSNVAIGGGSNGQFNGALGYNGSATDTVAIGQGAGAGTAPYANQGGTYLGYYAGYSAATSSNWNTLVGYQSGYDLSTGSYNIALGQNVDLPNNSGNQQLNIGDVLYGTGLYNGATAASSPTAAGEIGIGTTTPWAKLAISANSGDTNRNLFLISSSTPSATTTAFVVTNASNVGIGTTTPGSILSVQGVGNWTGATTTYYSTGGINLAAGCFSINGTCITGGGGSGTVSSGAQGQFAFYNAGGTTVSGTSTLFISQSGNIGFGTTTPGSILSVQGVGNFVSGATSTFYNGLNVAALNVTGNSTSTHADGINLLAGCFSVNGTCIGAGGGTGYTFSYPLLNTANTISEAWGTTTANTWSNLQTFTNGFIANSSSTVNGAFTATGFINTNSSSGGYEIGGSAVLYASSTSGLTLGGLGAGAALLSTTTAAGNTVFGYQALNTATSSSEMTAFGYQALANVNDYVATADVAVGYQALVQDTTGNANAAIGSWSLRANTTGNSNAAIGTSALSSNTTGNNNMGIGPYALYGNRTAGSGNVAVGAGALSGNFTPYDYSYGNTAIGNSAGNNIQGSASYNTLIGNNTGYDISTGSYNIALGQNVDLPSNTGNQQLNIGDVLYGSGLYGGATATSSPTASGQIGIGTTTPYSRLEVWGPNTGTTSAFAVVNNASTTEFTVYDSGNATLAGSLVQNSDQRLKTNIEDLDGSSSLAEINALTPVTFNWIDPAKSSAPQFGFIAQQVETVLPNLVSTTSPTALTPDGTLSLNYIDLISPIISAIQELDRELTALASTVAGFAENFATQHLVAHDVTAQELCAGSVCVDQQQLAAVLAATSQTGVNNSTNASSSSPIDTTDTPPVIEINGDNPATLQVGASYADLGATITGPQADLNLGITTYVNGAPMNPVQINTTQAATDTIDYVVTDSGGLTSTSTRTIIIQAQSPTAAIGDTGTSTEASTTPQ